MLGSELFRVDVQCDLSREKERSLVLLYAPLIGSDAYYLYNFLLIKGNSYGFNELSSLLNSLNFSIDLFESCIEALNKVRLVRTLSKEAGQYIFCLMSPLSFKEFIADDILVRAFILKVGSAYYQTLLADYRSEEDYQGYQDLSARFDPSYLNNWTPDNEASLKSTNNKTNYQFNTAFDMNYFLNDVSVYMLPTRYRTRQILSEVARLGDLYGISYDKMRAFVTECAAYEGNSFDLELLNKKCMHAHSEYRKVDDNAYSTPCSLFLMNLQGGKELTPFDIRVINNLSSRYHLSVPVINVLLQHSLKNCDNRLIENYVYAIAADLHRNNITTSSAAFERLDRFQEAKKQLKDKEPVYDDRSNPTFDLEEINDLLKNRGNDDGI